MVIFSLFSCSALLPRAWDSVRHVRETPLKGRKKERQERRRERKEIRRKEKKEGRGGERKGGKEKGIICKIYNINPLNLHNSFRGGYCYLTLETGKLRHNI